MSQPNQHAVVFAGRIAIVNYGLHELRRQLAGLAAIEQMLRRDEAAEPSCHDLFCQDLASLLATVNGAIEDKVDFLIGLAEANQQEVMQ